MNYTETILFLLSLCAFYFSIIIYPLVPFQSLIDLSCDALAITLRLLL